MALHNQGSIKESKAHQPPNITHNINKTVYQFLSYTSWLRGDKEKMIWQTETSE